MTRTQQAIERLEEILKPRFRRSFTKVVIRDVLALLRSEPAPPATELSKELRQSLDAVLHVYHDGELAHVIHQAADALDRLTQQAGQSGEGERT